MTRTIYVRFNRVGWHRWPHAPARRDYLASPHRHLFNIEVGLTVLHDDREVEFHDLLEDCKAAVPDQHKWGEQSCEAIAAVLARQVRALYPDRTITVDISEDGECGACLCWAADEAI